MSAPQELERYHAEHHARDALNLLRHARRIRAQGDDQGALVLTKLACVYVRLAKGARWSIARRVR